MGLGELLRRLFGGGEDDDSSLRNLPTPRGPVYGMDELARRLSMTAAELRAVEPVYHSFAIAKRAGGTRTIRAPSRQLKHVQRRILQRVLRRLKVHPCATGFERGHSTVSHALHHSGRVVVVRLDIQDFFPSTSANRVERYFRVIGWDAAAAKVLTRLCTHEGCLPQGAPTSPRLSNLVNLRMDARLLGLARFLGAAYSRYADDITFSMDAGREGVARCLINDVERIVNRYGYRLHRRRKRHIRRQHQRQLVAGLVVNAGVRLPRETRRWLRAVEHHQATGRPVTLTDAQLAGWRAYASMVHRQGSAPETPGSSIGQ